MRAFRIAAALGIVLTGAVALAQYGGYGQVSVMLDEETVEPSAYFTFPFFKTSCDQGLQNQDTTNNVFTLSWTPSLTGGDEIFSTTDSTCGTVPDGGAGTISKTFGLVQGQEAYVATINVEQVLSQFLNIQNPCDASPPPSGSFYICVSQPNPYGGGFGYGYGTTTTGTTNNTWYMTVNYNMSPPPAPTGVAVTTGDSELQIAWSYPSTTVPDHFIVYGQKDDSRKPNSQGSCFPIYAGAADAGSVDGGSAPDAGSADAGASDAGASDAGVDAGVAYGSQGSGSGAATTVNPDGWPIQSNLPGGSATANLTSLVNGHCYEVSIRAFYADGTEGFASAPIWEAPIEIFDYWRLYHQDGGQDPGGLHCQAAAGGLPPLAIVGSLLVWWRRRRRRRP